MYTLEADWHGPDLDEIGLSTSKDFLIGLSDKLDADVAAGRLRPELAAEAQSAIGYRLAELNAPDSGLAHIKAIHLQAADADADPFRLTQDIAVLVASAEAERRFDDAVQLQQQIVSILAATCGEHAVAHIEALRRLSSLTQAMHEVESNEGRKRELALRRQLIEVQLERLEAERAAHHEMGKSGELQKAGPEGAPDKVASPHVTMPILFTTTRRLDRRRNIYGMFANIAEDRPQFPNGHAGVAYVKVPNKREVGQSLLAKRGRRYNPLSGYGPYRYLYDQVDVLEDSAWTAFARKNAAERRARSGQTQAGEGLLYIHGFNMEFKEAMERAAQLGTDLDVAGLVSAFSWPADGTWKYWRDVGEPQAQINKTCLSQTILKAYALAREGNAPTRLVVIAHSMGNQLFVECIEELKSLVQSQGLGSEPLISDLILASPDEVPATLVNGIAKLGTLVGHVTIYCSHYDSALQTRSGFAKAKRAGVDRETLAKLVAQKNLGHKVDIVDTGFVKNLASSLRGHSDYATSAIDDLRMRVWLGYTAAERGALLQTDQPNGVQSPYWFHRAKESYDSLAIRRALEMVRTFGSIASASADIRKLVEKADIGGDRGAAAYWKRLSTALGLL